MPFVSIHIITGRKDPKLNWFWRLQVQPSARHPSSRGFWVFSSVICSAAPAGRIRSRARLWLTHTHTHTSDLCHQVVHKSKWAVKIFEMKTDKLTLNRKTWNCWLNLLFMHFWGFQQLWDVFTDKVKPKLLRLEMHISETFQTNNKRLRRTNNNNNNIKVTTKLLTRDEMYKHKPQSWWTIKSWWVETGTRTRAQTCLPLLILDLLNPWLMNKKVKVRFCHFSEEMGVFFCSLKHNWDFSFPTWSCSAPQQGQQGQKGSKHLVSWSWSHRINSPQLPDVKRLRSAGTPSHAAPAPPPAGSCFSFGQEDRRITYL